VHVGIDARIADYTAGGIAQYTRQLATWLPRVAGGDRFMLFRARWKPKQWAVSGGSVRERRLVTPAHHRWEQVLLPLELATARLDLLHGPDFVVPRRRRCPAVVTVHDLAFLRFPEILTTESRRYYAQVARVVMEVERVIVDSHHTAGDVRDLLGVPAERVRVVHLAPTPLPPAPDGPARAAVCASYGLDGPFFLYVGTLEPRKNLGRLLRAFERLDAGEQVRLALAGPRGWLDEPIVVEAERLGERVRLLGPVSAGDLAALYAAATAFVFPSLYEGFGLPPLEAMAAGTPVIAARASCLPEVLGDAARFVPPEDEGALADALVAVLGDPDLRDDLRRRGLARAAEFSWERTAAETLAVYREAVAQA
jgi:glycosyltransferase involved in cell wall biosynthesis